MPVRIPGRDFPCGGLPVVTQHMPQPAGVGDVGQEAVSGGLEGDVAPVGGDRRHRRAAVGRLAVGAHRHQARAPGGTVAHEHLRGPAAEALHEVGRLRGERHVAATGRHRRRVAGRVALAQVRVVLADDLDQPLADPQGEQPHEERRHLRARDRAGGAVGGRRGARGDPGCGQLGDRLGVDVAGRVLEGGLPFGQWGEPRLVHAHEQRRHLVTSHRMGRSEHAGTHTADHAHGRQRVDGVGVHVAGQVVKPLIVGGGRRVAGGSSRASIVAIWPDGRPQPAGRSRGRPRGPPPTTPRSRSRSRAGHRPCRQSPPRAGSPDTPLPGSRLLPAAPRAASSSPQG